MRFEWGDTLGDNRSHYPCSQCESVYVFILKAYVEKGGIELPAFWQRVCGPCGFIEKAPPKELDEFINFKKV